ncbi:MAG TPA: hypothetical protein VGC42_05415 [Kofleriaceae bacterium]
MTEPALQPKFTKVTKSVDLVAPPGCIASVILKQVTHSDGVRTYRWWMLAGRSGDDALSLHLKYDGEDMIRCDVPAGMTLSETELQPGLKAFVDSLGCLPGDGGIGTGPGSGGTGGHGS